MTHRAAARLARLAVCAIALAAHGPAAAFPSYGARTGQPCSACHVDVAGNPQALTAAGRSYQPNAAGYATPPNLDSGGASGSSGSDLTPFTYSGSCLLKYDYVKFRVRGRPTYHARFKLLFLQGVTVFVPARAEIAHQCGAYPGDDGDWQSIRGGR